MNIVQQPTRKRNALHNVDERIDDVRAFCHRRGWRDDVIDAFGIGPNHGAGIEYNCAGGRKVKTYPDPSNPEKAKYFWCDGCPPTGDYYHFGQHYDLTRTVAENGGALWLAAGEPDVWTLYAAGVRNALSFARGEAAGPPPLFAHDLAVMGVTILHCAPDRDDAGVAFAQKVRDALAGSGVTLQLYALPRAHGSHQDLNELWRFLACDPAQFRRTLRNLPALDLPTPPPAPVKTSPPIPENISVDHTAYRAKLEQVRPRLKAALGIDPTRRPSAKGFLKARCPFHDDHTPSASFHEQKCILKCHRCTPDDGEAFSAVQLCDRLGVAWPVDTPPRRHNPGLPTSAREALVQRGLCNVARFLDLAYALDLPPAFTVSDALATLGDFMSRRTLYRVLENSCQKCNIDCKVGRESYCFNFGTNSPDDDGKSGAPAPDRHVVASESGNPQGKGRRAAVYALPTPAAVCSALGCDTAGDDPLTLDDLRSNCTYRAALQRALYERRPGEYTRTWLGDRLGVGRVTTWRYDKVIGAKVEPQVTRQPVTPAVVAALPDDRKEAPWGRWLEIGGERLPPVRVYGEAALKHGEAYLCQQGPNRYSMGEA